MLVKLDTVLLTARHLYDISLKKALLLKCKETGDGPRPLTTRFGIIHRYNGKDLISIRIRHIHDSAVIVSMLLYRRIVFHFRTNKMHQYVVVCALKDVIRLFHSNNGHLNM